MVGVRRREQMFGKISAATERAKKVAGKAVAVAKTVNPIKSATAKKDKLKAKATGRARRARSASDELPIALLRVEPAPEPASVRSAATTAAVATTATRHAPSLLSRSSPPVRPDAHRRTRRAQSRRARVPLTPTWSGRLRRGTTTRRWIWRRRWRPRRPRPRPRRRL